MFESLLRRLWTTRLAPRPRRLTRVADRGRGRGRRRPAAALRRPRRRRGPVPHAWSSRRPVRDHRDAAGQEAAAGSSRRPPPVPWRASMKVLLRNPRRELEVPAPQHGRAAADRPRRRPRVGARDPQRHARDPRRAPARRRRRRDPARSSPGGAAMKCRPLPRAGGDRRPPPQRGLLRRLLHAPLPGAGPPRDRRPRHDRRRATACSSRCRAARTRSASGSSCASSATRPTASTSGSASASTPTRRATYARAFAKRARLAAARGRPARRRTASTFPSGAQGVEARAVLGVRALEAPRVQRRRARRTATTCSRPATTSTTKPRCCSATCCAGTTGYLGRQHPVLPAAPGFVRKVKPLVRLGERELAAYCVLTGIDYIVEECPMAAGNRHLGYKEMLNQIEERSPGTKAAFLFGFLERGHDRFAGDAVEERDDLRPCAGVRRADARRGLRVLPPARPRDAAASRVHGRAVSTRERARSRPATACCSSTTRAAPPRDARGRRAVPHPRRHRRARRPDRPPRRHHRAHVTRRPPRRGAADARRVRARDAARRAGDLSEGHRPDPRCSPTSSPARASSSRASARARSPPRCCARSARPVTSPATRSATTSRSARSQNVHGFLGDRRAARRRGARRLRGHRRARPRPRSCSTCPSRGAS